MEMCPEKTKNKTKILHSNSSPQHSGDLSQTEWNHMH